MIAVEFEYTDYELISELFKGILLVNDSYIESMNQIMSIENTGDLLSQEELKQKTEQCQAITNDIKHIYNKYFVNH